jgi:hypothetical protein
MKNTTLVIVIHLLSIAAIFGQRNPNKASNNYTLPSGCTVITISKGDSVFFAGNDDSVNPDSYYWVEQGDSSRYGVIWVGVPDNPQQGVNEKGLAYDSNGLPRLDLNPHAERVPFKGKYYHEYIMQIMHECSTVAEVIGWVNTHQRFPYMHDQLHFADKTGDAMIISAGKDGEMVFTRKVQGDGFLVSTNFNVANIANNTGYPCWRFDKANEMLSHLIEKVEPLTFSRVVNVMDAVHVERPTWTIETMVADLVNGVVYIYFFYQFDQPVVLNVKDELLNPREAGPLSQLFPDDVRQEAAKRFNKANAATKIVKNIAYIWLVLVALSTILFFIVCADYKKGLKMWLPAILILGPVALVLRCLAHKNNLLTNWSKALVETVMDIVPIVISYTLAVSALIVLMLSGKASPTIQIVMMFGLPLILGLVFHVSLLYPFRSTGFGKFILFRFAQILVTSFLALGGISALSMPVINNNILLSFIIPLSPLAVISWWAIVAAGSVVGGFFIFLYEYWAIRKDFTAWNILLGSESKIATPGWGKIWWWILISIIILFLGIAAGVNLTM